MLIQLNVFFLLLKCLKMETKSPFTVFVTAFEYTFFICKISKAFKENYFITNFNAFKIILYNLNLNVNRK